VSWRAAPPTWRAARHHRHDLSTQAASCSMTATIALGLRIPLLTFLFDDRLLIPIE
jgi:hypothetical protein